MTIEDFLKDDFFSLPKSQTLKEDYKLFVFKTLDRFIEKLEQFRDKNSEFSNVNFSMSSIIERQKHLTLNLKSAITSYYDGKPAKAYEFLNSGLDSNLKQFETLLNIRKFRPNYSFYRIRVYKNNYPLKSEELFHIPYQLRGKVKTQRFSIPGFPSLYLGTTLYVCWEEMNRPNINDFQTVRLINTETLKVIDLSPPNNNSDKYEYYKFLMIWPLVFTSSIKVRNYDDPFKPEYIIPQLLFQWVREKEEIDGIAYQTTHIDFTKNRSKGEFLNVVLPVKDNKIRGICSTLQKKFKMTEVTSIQLNELSTGGTTFVYKSNYKLNEKIKKLELIKGKLLPYDYSVFGKLERILLNMQTKKI